MATFKIDVQKTDGLFFWSNRYFVDSPDLGLAHSTAVEVIAEVESHIHNDRVTIDKVRTSTITPGDNIFLSTVLNLACDFADDAIPLPLFNVVRVDLTVGLGRPGRKFYRLNWGANRVVAGFKWDATSISSVTAAIDTMRVNADGAGTPIIDEGGELWTDATGFQPIGMRQLRRGSRRPTEPII